MCTLEEAWGEDYISKYSSAAAQQKPHQQSDTFMNNNMEGYNVRTAPTNGQLPHKPPSSSYRPEYQTIPVGSTAAVQHFSNNQAPFISSSHDERIRHAAMSQKQQAHQEMQNNVTAQQMPTDFPDNQYEIIMSALAQLQNTIDEIHSKVYSTSSQIHDIILYIVLGIVSTLSLFLIVSKLWA
jgi:hypothetical protein